MAFTRNTVKFIPRILLLFSFVMPALKAQQALPPSADLHRSEKLEDWNSLSLANRHLRADRPILGEKDDDPQFTRELIQLKWRPGDPINLYVIQPKGVRKPPAILYLYSYPSETDRFRDDRYCSRVTANGFAAIGFVSALTGQRYQNRPMKQWFVSELQEALASSVHDVQMILNYLESRGDLDLSRVGIFGAGSGGTIAILAASVDDRIKAIDALDPWGDWPHWLASSALIPDEERSNYLKPEFLKRLDGLDPVQWLPKLGSVQLRIQQLADDSVTPKTAREKISSVAPPSAELVTYEGNMQFYSASSGGRLFQWLKDRLKSDQGVHAQAGHLEKSQSPERQSAAAHP